MRTGNWDDRGGHWGKRSDHVVLPVAAKFPPLQTLTSPNLCPSLRGSPVQNFPRPDQFVSLLHLHQHHLFVFFLFTSLVILSLTSSSSFFSSTRNLARAVCPFLVRNLTERTYMTREFRSSPNLISWRHQFQSYSPSAARRPRPLVISVFLSPLPWLPSVASFQPLVW